MSFRIKILIALFLGLLGIKGQLDLEHWFPPIFRSGGNVYEHHLYLSTDKTVPFKVNVYNNNTVIATFMLSKSLPVDFPIEDDSMVYSGAARNTMKVSPSGLHVAGEKSFYASLRSNGFQSEVVASKGKSSMGESFFLVMDLNILYGSDPKDYNYFASIMATRDNTHIKLNGYNKDIVFCNGIRDDELDILLNKGESYIIAMEKKDNNPKGIIDDDDPNLIGAFLTADKPIVVNNGNFKSQDLGEGGGNANIDQTMPLKRIGKEYFFVNGLVNVESGLEKLILVATEDNTELYFNDEFSPFSIRGQAVSLNKGQYLIGPYPYMGLKFIKGDQPVYINSYNSKKIDTYGMYLKASKPLYAFQMIGGYYDISRIPQTENTSGMLFSYPLDKDSFPNTMVIPFIEKVGSKTYDNKLTIKSEDGATILINGLPVHHGTPILGKKGWSYYSYNNLTGNIEISSDKALFVDVVGGKQYTGYGSSYTSFSNDPQIIQYGYCVQQEVVLKISNKDFERIQWQIDGVDIPNANGDQYIPIIPGNYSCDLYYADFKYTVGPIKIVDCPYKITEVNYGKNCTGFDTNLKYSTPNESLDIESVQIEADPINGKLVVQNSKINYEPNANFAGTDRFVYKICSKSGFCETFKVSLEILKKPSSEFLSSLAPISQKDELRSYNLLNSIISNPENNLIQFFEKYEDAVNRQNPIVNPQLYTTLINKKVYANSSTLDNCSKINEINLEILPSEIKKDKPHNVITPNGDGINDTWNYKKVAGGKDFQLYIFDRYGRRVYQHEGNLKYYWDGKNPIGLSYPSGTYWVFYSYLDDSGKTIEKSMWVYLRNSAR